MHDGEKNGLLRFGFTGEVRAIAKDEAQRIRCLVPCAISLHLAMLIRLCQVVDARLFQRVSQICSRETIAKKFRECAATSTAWGMKVIVDVRFARRREEQEPIFLDGGARTGRISSEFSERWIGFERT